MTVKELIEKLKEFPQDAIVAIPSVSTSVVVEEMEAEEVCMNEYDRGPLIC